MSSLVDKFGRRVTNLRISVTDRCNFRCRYCMPEEGMVWLEHGDLLTYEEITRLTTILASLGVERVRLTGGEPLMRKELWKLIRNIRGVDGIRDIALTTNGYFLEEQASLLAGAGLNRINVSLDALDNEVFQRMRRRDELQKVWKGIEAAGRAGLAPIKLNVVMIRGINDAEILDLADLASSGRFIVRFIEFMPIGLDDDWLMENVVPTSEILDIITTRYPLVPLSSPTSGSASDRYAFKERPGEIGFISSVTRPFCTDCDRIRLTSDGKLRTCLFSLTETDLRSMLRNGASDSEIAAAITDAVWIKEEGHLINRPGFVRPERTMSQIGG